LASLGTKWRANLRKAQGAGLIVREVDPQTSLPAFMTLYGAMTDRKHFVDRHHVEHLPAFIAAAPPTLGVRMFVASQDGKPVAASLIAGPGDRVSIPFSASNDKALALR